ncbi:DUF2019 domain-containing protein [Bosea rubneri]|uniref:DUF2019 domain-containing protein n=1 Tax=Bosea rubneri TaxID=3075434 RepID=A0ABU3SHX6_9HYPH|nr:DUF2019 domain-containing protein [Bosea sp. ZW T0_25]MDU0344007.1 DUF2019 domain-containing protein [Bosea sp. ZW T0_25]
MSLSKLKPLSTSELKLLFEQLCIEQYNALERDEIAAFNRRYDRIQAIQDELKSRPGDQRRVLMELFGHRNMQVRLTAAHATLALDTLAARRELRAIADSKWYPQAANASMALDSLDSGFYKPT